MTPALPPMCWGGEGSSCCSGQVVDDSGLCRYHANQILPPRRADCRCRCHRGESRHLGPCSCLREPAVSEQGGVLLWLLVVAVGLFLVAGLFFGACDAFFDDESEPGDLGTGTPTELVQ